MKAIPTPQTNDRFRDAVRQFKVLKGGELTTTGINHLVREMREAFNEDIKPREFSI